jgi:hypothetical protein
MIQYILLFNHFVVIIPSYKIKKEYYILRFTERESLELSLGCCKEPQGFMNGRSKSIRIIGGH